MKVTFGVDGVLAVHQKLHADFALGNGRRYFGISYPAGKGTIVYKAGTEELATSEAEKTGYETFILKKGNYIYKDVLNFRENIAVIGKTFSELLIHTNIDPNGCCVEEYLNETDVRCMVRLQ